MLLRTRIVALALGTVCASDVGAPSSKRMPDGKLWTTQNLNVVVDPSYCYDDAEQNCVRYGRLYTWASAQKACGSLGDGWRLPTNDEWRQLAKQYGGLLEDSKELGQAAYSALRVGGSSGFDILLGGGRTDKSGEYARLEAHGFFWTTTESGPAHAWFYNLGKGMSVVNRHPDGKKEEAFSVRCIQD
jgi:uncharacterized protein (TIGR02145 family)